MKRAVVFSVPMSTGNAFVWRWRSDDHKHDSTQSFSYYADCVADATRNGYEVALGRIEAYSNVAERFNGKRA